MTSNIKIKKINNEVASIIIDEPKTYNSLSFKNLSDLLKALKNLDNDKKNIPVIGEISAPGKLEGGDIVWINKNTIAVGIGYRSNIEGVEQLEKILFKSVKDIIPVALPHWNGPNDCLHLMSNLSPIDHNLFLVYLRLLPVEFIQYLSKNGIELIDVPDKEYQKMACNVLTVSPKEVIMLEGNPLTKNLLEKRKLISLRWILNNIEQK